jgi:hypothetical protein
MLYIISITSLNQGNVRTVHVALMGMIRKAYKSTEEKP